MSRNPSSLYFQPRSSIFRRRGTKTTTAAAPQSQTTQNTQQPSLQPFFGWLVANGVEGIGQEASKIALFNSDTGERGVVAVAPLRRGEAAVRVPLRLAITDHPDDEESNAVMHEGAPWSVRLAAKILRMKKQGDACPWAPYIAALPSAVPSPMTSLSWEDTQEISYEPMRRHMDAAVWLASTSWAALLPGSIGNGTLREEFDWALSVVHSRTFGAAGKGGGVGVRMLVPLIDMLNHAGDVICAQFGAADPTAIAQDNVRWDLVSKIGGEQVMVLSATRDIAAGEELLLSYGERSNEDFFLFYGFVPPRNPHDTVALFASIEDAIDWHLDKYFPIGSLSPSQLQVAITNAYAASQAEEDPDVRAVLEKIESDSTASGTAPAGISGADAENIRAEAACMKLLSGGRVDGRLAAAFSTLHSAARTAGAPVDASCQGHVRDAVAARAAEILRDLYSRNGVALETDLERLAAWEVETSETFGDQGHAFALALKHYGSAIKTSKAAASIYQGNAGRSSSPPLSTAGSGGGSQPEEGILDAGAGSDDADLLELLAASNGMPSFSASSTGDGFTLEESGSQGPSSLLPVMYRAYKCQILWDAVLA